MAKTKHTPEPWFVDSWYFSPRKSYTIRAKAPRPEEVSLITGLGSARRGSDAQQRMEANAERIVACVNAMEGIADPAAFMSAVMAECSDHCEPDGSPCRCSLCTIFGEPEGSNSETPESA